ncbi:MAG: dihydrolipoyl dehydrogenase [Spartobacteria bacterium]|nr:dihydrolipoyl dehydrogenase [Spartobacteria bacterium]
MNERRTDIAVIGAGSAGLSAFREALRHTENVLLIDPGPLGTTCARTGCMPSKALIHTAATFYQRHFFKDQGVDGAEMLSGKIPLALKRVRTHRERFAGGMEQRTHELAGNRLISERAVLLDENRIQAGPQTIRAERIILAVGAEPIVPDDWKLFGDRVLTSETIFEQKDLPKRMAVIGLGPIGLELGQALSRLGLDITAFSFNEQIGGLSDPQVNRELIRCIKAEFPLYLGKLAEVDELESGELIVRSDHHEVQVDALLAAVGVSPNLNGIGLEKLGINPKELPCDAKTGQLGDRPIYVAGDANGYRPVLHEAVDEGTLAAAHALRPDQDFCNCRRVPLRIVFSDPEIAVVGTAFSELPEEGVVTGVVDFEDQARAVIENRNAGRLHVYAEQKSGRLLGAEMCAPDAASFGHLLALAIQQQCTVVELLQMPFYHPTLIEALRTALRHAAEQCDRELKTNAHLLDWCCAESPLT